ncbi:MAG: Ig-like domain-containing protein [bacterium]|nr:Ig-like domain-containing protein [bacterium]
MVLLSDLPAFALPSSTIAVSIVSPADGTVVTSSSVPVTVSFSTTREPLVALEFSIDDRLYDRYVSKITKSGQYTFNWNSATYTDGEHILRVSAYGQYGSISAAESKVRLQKTDVQPPPTDPGNPSGISGITLQVPQGNPLTGTVTLSVSLKGSGPIERITYLIDGQDRFYTNKADKGFAWNTTADYDGRHKIQASVLTEGRLLVSQQTEVIVNNGRTVTNIAWLDYVPASGLEQERVESLPVSTVISARKPPRILR